MDQLHLTFRKERKWVSRFLVLVMVFNATFNNILVILWRLVFLVKETGIPGENHRPVASHLLLQSSLYYYVMFVQFFMSMLYVMMFSYCRRFVKRRIYISSACFRILVVYYILYCINMSYYWIKYVYIKSLTNCLYV